MAAVGPNMAVYRDRPDHRIVGQASQNPLRIAKSLELGQRKFRIVDQPDHIAPGIADGRGHDIAADIQRGFVHGRVQGLKVRHRHTDIPDAPIGQNIVCGTGFLCSIEKEPSL